MSNKHNVYHQSQQKSKNIQQHSNQFQKHSQNHTYEQMIKLSSTAKYYKCNKDEIDINAQPLYNSQNNPNIDHQVLFASLKIHSSQQQSGNQTPKIPKLNLNSQTKVIPNVSFGYPRLYEDKKQYFTRQSAIVQNNPAYQQYYKNYVNDNFQVNEYFQASQ
ncbi:hypothetical protein TTHERM_000621179 (macronuclear) [Tetrahymena thermophila SB210]|uniref:Uncharacterized protein n=1 Tax=Tetrahymena thermophila (strain SB210) TaxID=312017 RepID=W7XHN3_TETTS|nr:hypothetical protein TTHERM_000621179 [Tetrahymena thermophila SB210]EWS73926.1 hypothetical protein TTHERM_000621179 [Tetrahymena thermophila SB210]|eukprot:XP_012653548.1 hypothetical protein TTHERM_000621179 [Tetrahymena thermophila SB210]